MQIVVLGMHRSGTSAVARILNLMGCYIGPEEKLMKANEANPKGYWERLDVIEANDRALEAMGGCWYDVADLEPAEKLPERELEGLTDEVRGIVRDLNAHRPWMVKDPRLCLVLPLWLRLLENPIVVLTHRHPTQVARSLERRDGLPLEVGMSLWEAYVLSSLRLSSGYPRVLVRYEELLDDPVERARQLHGWLADQGVEGLSALEDREVEAFIDPGLQRSRCDGDEDLVLPEQTARVLRLLEGDGGWDRDPPPALSAEARRDLKLYGPVRRRLERAEEELVACERRRQEQLRELEVSYRALEAHNRQLETSYRALDAGFRELEVSYRALEAHNRELETSCRALETAHRSLEAGYRDLETAQRRSETVLRDKDRVLGEVSEELSETARSLAASERRCRRLERAVAELDAIIEDLLTAKSRRVGQWLSWPWRALRGRSVSIEEERSAALERLAKG